ncbi:ABC transporter permease [Tissierella pigra]|uniref:ABC transporter permease n=3 Tax=Tissierella pigra TaxID=2607614 RepID=UPI001C0FE835|nr:ABC transporter permease [Tissierella pigra]MBU5427680.1 ABC transporter permease [Tissierella pigra]
MKIINEYTYEHLKNNKRHTISILVAITIASVLLFSLCIFLYSMWESKLNVTIDEYGYWQGEIMAPVFGEKLKHITENPDVESTMIKGNWYTAELHDAKRPYLLSRDANKDFWNNMNFKNSVLEGRLPEESGEIVISKLFFTDNPQYKVGDKLILPVGNRMLNNEILSTNAYKQEGETFEALETKTYTIVGKLDISGISLFPGYIAMGYLDTLDILPTDGLTVYMNFKNPRKIYKELPDIAESVGLDKNEYGQYEVRYNTMLLNLYGISDKNTTNIQLILILAIVVIMILLIMGAFILIIYNAFALSANSRIKELSILKSLGATPKQIKLSVLYEGLLLWVIQLPLSLIIGYIFSNLVFSKVNGILSLMEDYKSMQISFSWIAIVFSLALSLITVIVSAYIPARKVAKVPAVSGILQNSQVIKIKKPKPYLVNKNFFGIEGELASSRFYANKKSLRVVILSLTMSFVLIASYINIISIYNLADSKNDKELSHDITLDLNIADEPDIEMINKITLMAEVKDSVIRRQVRTAIYVGSENESHIFSSLGGLSGINSNKYNVLKEDDKYRIIVNLVGLSDESFKKYCKDIGADYEKYNTESTVSGILINATYHTFDDSKITEEVPLLNIKEGSQMWLYEKIDDSMRTNNNFDIKISDITDKYPTEINSNRYNLALIVPMEKYIKIVDDFSSERILESNRMSISLLVGDDASPRVKKELIQIASSYLGAEDFSIWTLLEEKNHKELVQQAIKISISAIALMIGIIGIFNAFSIVTNNMRLRKKEFAMLRSIGLTPKGLNKMLTLEGLLFALMPILISIPIVFIICWYMLNLTPITWGEYISVFPSKSILIYAILIFMAISFSYWISSRSVKRSNIIESMRDEVL